MALSVGVGYCISARRKKPRAQPLARLGCGPWQLQGVLPPDLGICKVLGSLRVSRDSFRNLPVLVEIETVEIFLEICRSFRAPVVSRSPPPLENLLLARVGKFCEQTFPWSRIFWSKRGKVTVIFPCQPEYAKNKTKRCQNRK